MATKMTLDRRWINPAFLLDTGADPPTVSGGPADEGFTPLSAALSVKGVVPHDRRGAQEDALSGDTVPS